MAFSKYVVIHGGIKIPHKNANGDLVSAHAHEAPRGKPPTIIECEDSLAIQHLDVLEPLALFEAKMKAKVEGDKLIEKAKADAEAQVKATVLKIEAEHQARLATHVQKAKG